MKSRAETITREINPTKDIITSPGAQSSSFPTTTTVMGAVGVVIVADRGLLHILEAVILLQTCFQIGITSRKQANPMEHRSQHGSVITIEVKAA